MGILSRNKQVRAETKIEHRAQVMATHDLISWAETSLYDIGKSLLDYQEKAHPVSTADAVRTTETLWVLVQELDRRAQG